MKTTRILLTSDDWEGLYIDGILVGEDHSLEDPQFWIDMTNKYNIVDLEVKHLRDEDVEQLEGYGTLPDVITKFKHDYTK